MRAVLRPTDVPPRFSSLRHSRPRFASAITASGIVYMRSLLEKTLISKSVRAAAASSTEGPFGLSVSEFHVEAAIKGSLTSKATTRFFDSSTTAPRMSDTKRNLDPLRPI